MKPSESEQNLIDSARQALDQIPLDAATTQHLDRARQQALTHNQNRTARWAMPMAAFASLGAIALAATLWLEAPQPLLPVDNIDAFEIISKGDDLELYQNLEFYLWLDQQGDTGVG